MIDSPRTGSCFSVAALPFLFPRIVACGVTLLCTLLAISASAWDFFRFDLPSGCKESLWRDSLAAQVGGVTEFRTAAGRVDVCTSNEVFEVDWPHKWKEGMGQALAYAAETGRHPVLVLIAYGQGPDSVQGKTRTTFEKAEKTCRRHGVRLLVLFPSKPESFPHTATNSPAASPVP